MDGTNENGQLEATLPSAKLNYCTVQNWTGTLGGVGNNGLDPLFVDADGIPGMEANDVRLSPGSPCIDSGDNTVVPVGVTTDLDGNNRFVDEPATVDSGNGTPPIVDRGTYEYQGFEDCNTNGLPDDQEVANGTSPDCNSNGVPDEGDASGGTSQDCNLNAVPDDCDLTGGTSGDCNESGTPDECDVAAGTSPDCDSNGIPNDCVLCGVPSDCDDCNARTIDGCFEGRCFHISPCVKGIPGDMDGDGDIDLRDYAILSLCFSGPGGAIPESCPFQRGP